MREGVRGDVLGDPGRVACPSVEGGCQGRCWAEVGDGPGEAVLEESVGVDGRLYGGWSGDLDGEDGRGWAC